MIPKFLAAALSCHLEQVLQMVRNQMPFSKHAAKLRIKDFTAGRFVRNWLRPWDKNILCIKITWATGHSTSLLRDAVRGTHVNALSLYGETIFFFFIFIKMSNYSHRIDSLIIYSTRFYTVILIWFSYELVLNLIFCVKVNLIRVCKIIFLVLWLPSLSHAEKSVLKIRSRSSFLNLSFEGLSV